MAAVAINCSCCCKNITKATTFGLVTKLLEFLMQYRGLCLVLSVVCSFVCLFVCLLVVVVVVGFGGCGGGSVVHCC